MGPQDMVTLRSVRKLVNCGLFLLLQKLNYTTMFRYHCSKKILVIHEHK